MQTWARRGTQTALVTGGVLMLGTGIASATENVNPDRPAPPIDGGGSGDIGQFPIAVPVEPVLGAGDSTADGCNDTATTAGGNVWTSGEWGDLADDQAATTAGPDRASGPPAGATTVYDVPGEVLGRAVDSRFRRLVVRDGDTAPRLDVPFGGAEEQPFGLFDDVEGLLRADQVPALRNLPASRVAPLPLDATQVFPVLSDGLPATVDAPVPEVPVERLSGELPVSGSLPRIPGRPGAQSGTGLPAPYLPGLFPGDLPKPGPHVQAGPSLPAPPQLPGPITETLPRLGGPGLPPHLNPPNVPSLPNLRAPRLPDRLRTEQEAPAASAEQLMAQLRGLINELQSAESDQLRPLDVTSFHEPDADEL